MSEQHHTGTLKRLYECSVDSCQPQMDLALCYTYWYSRANFKWNVHMWYLAVHMAVGKWLRWVHKSNDSVYSVLVPLLLEVTSHVTCWLMAVSCRCCCCPLKPWVIWAGSLPGRQQTQSEQWHTKNSTNQSPRTNNVSSALAFGIPLNISPVQNASCYLEEKSWD